MTDALPCIVCRTPLDQAMNGHQLSESNQPSDGVCASTIGNYGSTVYDSMGGTSRLVFSVCDDCLKKAGEDGIVMYWRQAREVVVEDPFEMEPLESAPETPRTIIAHAHVGWEPLDRPLIIWDPTKNWEHEDGEDKLIVEQADVGTKMGKVEWR